MNVINRYCWNCHTKDNLTIHHIKGGKLNHRKNNPYQKEWEKLGIEKVRLCKSCHKLLHNQLLFKEGRK